MDKAETWRDIPGLEGQYQASSEGRIRSLDRTVLAHGRRGLAFQRKRKGQILAPGYAKRTGYWIVIVGSKATQSVHTLVCAAFHGPRPSGYDVAHLNGNKSDNRAANLTYATRKDNLSHQLAHGTRQHGETRWNAKLTNEAVLKAVAAVRAGAKPADVARQIGSSTTNFYHILSGRCWGRVTGITSP